MKPKKKATQKPAAAARKRIVFTEDPFSVEIIREGDSGACDVAHHAMLLKVLGQSDSVTQLLSGSIDGRTSQFLFQGEPMAGEDDTSRALFNTLLTYSPNGGNDCGREDIGDRILQENKAFCLALVKAAATGDYKIFRNVSNALQVRTDEKFWRIIGGRVICEERSPEDIAIDNSVIKAAYRLRRVPSVRQAYECLEESLTNNPLPKGNPQAVKDMTAGTGRSDKINDLYRNHGWDLAIRDWKGKGGKRG